MGKRNEFIGGDELLIDKKDIERAKEKLGDNNATIIAELLGLEDYDDKNLKACCPYHIEDTPSFIYNKLYIPLLWVR